MTKVLFVCLGNICRSPLAEAIFNHECEKESIKNTYADSAGTGAYHVGDQPDPRTIKVARKNGVPINHKARQFQPEDCDHFDYIFALDSSNYENIIQIAGKQPDNLYMLREFDIDKNGIDVPDPYYGGTDGFDLIFAMMSQSINGFIRTKLN
ncbi:MAG: low molecular weight phosphotyrosine protein phosphatase [Cyclobacteriaceae bacterium]